MSVDPPFQKIFDRVATRKRMFELFNRTPDGLPEDRISGKAYLNQWFEIERDSYEEMLDVLPPRFMRVGMFAMSELKAGTVGSVFFDIVIDGRTRYFHGYCNFADRDSPDVMRAAIIDHEKAAVANLTRKQKLNLIWATTHSDFRGLAGEANPDAWPAEHHGKRSILVYETGVGTVCKLLEDLSDDEIADRLPHGRTY
ncbi:DUF1419 domain-containing protein [Aquamicrobium sp.]|uniref:DUF1419 domain-containing protein n=1 Tax=Aquamicrobium sp. TaxID=1872579 RepID=UPI0025893534|nr:DUF1419 domain-containing protein [Aquamicrobium sp.]MCK9549533.1 DUF1419 domain-containing protein [Aquamicrobium sp.]